MSSMDRENSLWRLVGSFGWTVQVPRGQWDFPKAPKEVMEKVFDEHQHGGAHPIQRRKNKSAKHFSRNKKLSTHARVRPKPAPYERNRGKGTSLRWLPTLTEADQKDDRFGPNSSNHFINSPEQRVIIGKPSKKDLKQIPRPRTAEHHLKRKKSYHFKNNMHPVYLHRVKSLSKHPDASMATFMVTHDYVNEKKEEDNNNNKESKSSSNNNNAIIIINEQKQKQIEQERKRQEMHDDFVMYTPEDIPFDLKSPTSKHHHKTQQYRPVEITINYPTKINEITLLKVKAMIEKKHKFKPLFPDERYNRNVNKRGKKRLTEEDDEFVNTYKWSGTLNELWALGEEIHTTYPSEFLLSCDDFYVLARSQGWCKTYVGKPLSKPNLYKIIEIHPTADAVSSRPSTAPSTSRSSILRKGEEQRKMFKKKKKKIEYEKEPIHVPYVWPGKQVNSQHRNLWAPDFPNSTREQHEQMRQPKKDKTMTGPGSFRYPTSMEKQIETMKRNMVHITSMKTKSKRRTPLQNCALGYIESPGPQVYVPPSMIRTNIGVRFGQGMVDPYKLQQMERKLKRSDRKNKKLSKEEIELIKLEKEINQLQNKTFLMRRGIKKLAGTKELLLR